MDPVAEVRICSALAVACGLLADTRKAIPGNTMPFPGVPDAAQRAEIIEYLKAVK